ncbi:hypothetical protein DXT99_19950 [Pontibacter diazotrophicus]|uniref:Uncharacterized protein n=1 Tax=Pontibacter diazotrophicus TaxID=1400979 RepID=A0A3D8L7E9_9BACT|nr:hypothetical protein [Pontibacter diazotrophicus]RDV13297.1 hypothetical protein DXT99_19950 [Pontibacter diazotrophicus]
MRIDIIRNEQFVRRGEKLYPVHLDNEELFSIIDQVLEELFLYGRSTVRAFVRKDRGAKGVDFRVRVTRLWEGEPQPVRQYAFGINSNWEVEGFFDHWADVNGKPAAEEITGRKMPVLEQILRERTSKNRRPVRNRLFDGDGWTCVYEHSNNIPG